MNKRVIMSGSTHFPAHFVYVVVGVLMYFRIMDKIDVWLNILNV